MQSGGRHPHLLQVRYREPGQGRGFVHVGCYDCGLGQQPLDQKAQSGRIDQALPDDDLIMGSRTTLLQLRFFQKVADRSDDLPGAQHADVDR